VTNTLLSLAFVTLVTCNIAQAQETPIGGVEMGQSEATATSTINAACDRVARIEVMATRFPAASESEVHPTPQFMTVIREFGIFKYWKFRGFPPQCKPIGDDDFECGRP
jgi:hypothetical protein